MQQDSGNIEKPDRNMRRSIRGAKSREAIIAAAQRLFADRGYQSVSLDEVAARAGSTRSLILYHFKSKIGLWRAASADAAEALNTSVRSKLGRIGKEFARKSNDGNELYLIMAAWLDAFLENPMYPKMLVMEGVSQGQRLDWLIEHFEHADYIPGPPILRERLNQTVLRDALMAVFLAMSALGPLMEASMAKVSGQKKVGIYPMSANRREELISVLLRFVTSFEGD